MLHYHIVYHSLHRFFLPFIAIWQENFNSRQFFFSTMSGHAMKVMGIVLNLLNTNGSDINLSYHIKFYETSSSVQKLAKGLL